MIDNIILELADELVDPTEAVLDDQLEEEMEDEEDIMLGIGDEDDKVIEFIANGNRLRDEDPINFTDDEVDDTMDDDDEDEDIDDTDDNNEDETVSIDDIEEAFSLI